MRFLFVTSGPRVPTTRFRVLPYLPFLERAGHRCDVAHSFPEKYEYFRSIGWRLSQRLKRTVRHWHAALAGYRKYDAIFIEREVFDDDTWDLEERFRSVTPRLILDVDDGIFLRHPEKFDRTIAIADIVIAGNRFIADYVASRTTSLQKPPQIEQIPTCIRLSDYQVAQLPHRESKKPIVGWIGTSHNLAYLSEATWALSEAAKRVEFKLLIVTGNMDHLPLAELEGLDWEFRAWRPDREAADLREIDIGLMPLPAGNEWMIYKCGLKLIQYMAVGIPGIASPIGVNSEILANQSAGRLADTPETWLSALTELLTSPQLRHACGAEGRKLVERSFSIEAHWAAIERILVGR